MTGSWSGQGESEVGDSRTVLADRAGVTGAVSVVRASVTTGAVLDIETRRTIVVFDKQPATTTLTASSRTDRGGLPRSSSQSNRLRSNRSRLPGPEPSRQLPGDARARLAHEVAGSLESAVTRPPAEVSL